MKYRRIVKNQINKDLFGGKIIILYGPRQVGKTTMVKEIIDEATVSSMYISCDIPSRRALISMPEPEIIKKNIGDAKLLILDEAQMVENIGLILKVLHDTYPDIQIIATGSSSFDLANKIKEPLTGRAKEYTLYPLSFQEIMLSGKNILKTDFEDYRLRFGFYPGMPEGMHDATEYLATLQANTLYKDILALENIRKPKVLEDLIILLANRIGSIITTNSIANEIKTTASTVERYLNLLEKMFVVKRLYAYSHNPNNERKKGYKIYFVDIGIRNSIINQHDLIKNRMDNGALFENYFIMERIKFLSNNKIYNNKYFWQNYKQIEVDYIEEANGKLYAYECKYKDRSSKGLKIFHEQYSNTISQTVTMENYDKYLLKE